MNNILTEEQQVYKKAIDKYGIDTQIIIMIEEMTELTKELCKYKRGRPNESSIAEEIADVEIMLNQIKQAMDLEYLTKIYKSSKLEKLKLLIQAS